MNRDFEDMHTAALIQREDATIDLRWEDCNTLAFQVQGDLWIKGIPAAPRGRIGMAFGTFDLKQVKIDDIGLNPSAIDRYDYHSPWREAFAPVIEKLVLDGALKAVGTDEWAGNHFGAMMTYARDLMSRIEEIAPKAATDTGRHRTWQSMLDSAFRSLSAIDQSISMHTHPFEEGYGYIVLRDGDPVPVEHSEASRWKGWLPRYVHALAQRAYEQALPDDVVHQATIYRGLIHVHDHVSGFRRPINPKSLEAVQSPPQP